MKMGYHAVYAESYFSGIDDAKRFGFDFVQFDLGVPTYFLNDLTSEQLAAIREYAQNSGVALTFHSPGDNVSLFCDYPLIRQGILDEFKLLLEKANALSARHMTFHTGMYPTFKKIRTKADDSRAEYYEQVLYDNLKTLTDNSGDVLICVENSGLKAAARNTIQRLIDDTGKLFLTLDIAKMYGADRTIAETDFQFFRKNQACIREIHIHDRNAAFGSHQLVGDGFIDFSLFQPFLNENTYLNFEIRPVEAAKQSMNALLSRM